MMLTMPPFSTASTERRTHPTTQTESITIRISSPLGTVVITQSKCVTKGLTITGLKIAGAPIRLLPPTISESTTQKISHITHLSGDQYVGQTRRDEPDGRGILVDRSGIYIGRFEEGLRHGFGIQFGQHSTVYCGVWKGNVPTDPTPITTLKAKL